MSKKTCTIQVNIRWGAPDDQPIDPSIMPDDLIRAQHLWQEAGGRGATDQKVLTEMCKITARCLSCTFVADNLFAGVNDLAIDDEIEAEEITVQAADFSDGCVPTICAGAVFKLPMHIAIESQDDLEAWQEENDYLDNAIVFSFHPNDDSDYIGSLWNHQGITVSLPGEPNA